MQKTNQLYPALVRKYGQEDTEIAEKTWPLVIPSDMRLVAILSDKPCSEVQTFEVALDVTEQNRYMTYLDQLRNGKWASARMYYLPAVHIDRCRHRYDP